MRLRDVTLCASPLLTFPSPFQLSAAPASFTMGRLPGFQLLACAVRAMLTRLASLFQSDIPSPGPFSSIKLSQPPRLGQLILLAKFPILCGGCVFAIQM